MFSDGGPVSTIRPPVWPQATSATTATPANRPAPDTARAAAQKAFFESALGRTAAPAPAEPAVTPRASTPVVHETPLRSAAVDEPPRKIPRPGSFVNILV